MSSARSVKKKRAVKPAKAAAPAKSAKTTKKAEASNATVEMCRELAALVEAHTLSELIVDTKDGTLTFRRGMNTVMSAGGVMPTMAMQPQMHAPAPAPLAAAPAAAAPAAPVDDSLHKVTSPFVGTFYRSPNPDSPAYCEVGQRVEKGQVLCIVEAMKLMNEIEADIAGTIEAIVAENAEPVEYGQTLFKIKA